MTWASQFFWLSGICLTGYGSALGSVGSDTLNGSSLEGEHYDILLRMSFACLKLSFC